MNALKEHFLNIGIEQGNEIGRKKGYKKGFDEGVIYQTKVVYQNAIRLGFSEELARELAYCEPTPE